MLQSPLTYVRPGLIFTYQEGWLSTEASLFRNLAADLVWQQGSVRLFGREISEPRLTSWVGDVSYSYSGRILDPRPWPEYLKELRRALDADIVSLVNTPFGFNHCLVNG